MYIHTYVCERKHEREHESEREREHERGPRGTSP